RFLQMAAATPALGSNTGDLPVYRTVTQFKPESRPGMPGRYLGTVVRTHSEKSIDADSEKVDASTVREMLSRGMRELTGHAQERDSWAHFFAPSDVVGIKVNCSGAPGIMSTPEIVAGIVDNLVSVGIAPDKIHIYERFLDQLL